ncbi:MAG: M48 family metalloprotease [Thermoproteota archaeon]
MSSTAKRPGVNFFKFVMITFWIFFAAGVAISVMMGFIGLESSIIMGGVLLVTLYVLLHHLLLRRWCRSDFVKLKGFTVRGIPIYIVDDDLANALAVGIWKKSYIVITSGLASVLNDEELKAVLEHEENHVILMHPLINLLGSMTFLFVFLSFVSLLIPTPYLLVVDYVTLFLVGNLLLRAFNRGLERMADKVSNPNSLHNGLIKMGLHNECLFEKTPPKESRLPSLRFLHRIFSTHPPTEERDGRAEPSLIKKAGVFGAYVFFLVAFNLGVKLINMLGFTGDIAIFVVGFILLTSIIGTGFIVIDYLFMLNLVQLLSKPFKIEPPASVNVVNSMIAFLVLTAIPTILSTTSPLITYGSMIIAFIAAILLMTLECRPFRKALILSIIAWLVHATIFLTTFLILAELTRLKLI